MPTTLHYVYPNRLRGSEGRDCLYLCNFRSWPTVSVHWMNEQMRGTLICLPTPPLCELLRSRKNMRLNFLWFLSFFPSALGAHQAFVHILNQWIKGLYQSWDLTTKLFWFLVLIKNIVSNDPNVSIFKKWLKSTEDRGPVTKPGGSMMTQLEARKRFRGQSEFSEGYT